MDVFLYFHGLQCRTAALENESQHSSSSIDTSTDKPLNSIKHHLTVRAVWPCTEYMNPSEGKHRRLIPVTCVCGSEDHISRIKLFNVEWLNSDNSEVYVSDQWTLYRVLQKSDSFRCPECFLGRDFNRLTSTHETLWVYALQYILYVSYTFGPAVVFVVLVYSNTHTSGIKEEVFRFSF